MSGVFKGLFGTDKGTVQTVNNNEPPAFAVPYIQGVLQKGYDTLNTAPNPSAQYTQQAGGALNSLLNPNFLSLNPESNPAFRSSVNDALGLAKSQFAGQYGGPAGQNLNNSGYQESLARGLGAAATNAYANQYNANLNFLNAQQQRQLGALAAAPSLDAASYATSPFTNLERYASLFGPTIGNRGTTTGQQPYYQNNTANTLGTLGTLGILAATL